MATIEIIESNVIDNSVKDTETGLHQPSEISVHVEFFLDDKYNFLEFQTTNTMDYGAFSSNLEAYEPIVDEDVIEQIVALINPEKLWDEYVKEKYTVNEDYFDGMDANSCINEMTAKEA